VNDPTLLVEPGGNARIGWPCRLRNLHVDAPGKRAYVRTMHEIYRGQISDFNATYGMQFDSFDALQAALDCRLHTDLSNGNETRDNVEFLKKVVAKYYQTARDAIRRYDPNHLIKSMPTLILWTQCYRLQANSPISYFIRCMRDTRCRNQV
jgi:hypothetical protein